MTTETTTKRRSVFSKRHYDFVAALLRANKPERITDAWLDQVMVFVAAFKRDNHAFITVRFMQACGMTRGEANRALEGHTEHE